MPGYHWLPDRLKSRLLEAEGLRDAERLEGRVPMLATALAEVEGRYGLEEAHRAYLEEAGTDPAMAASPAFARFLVAWCQARRPRRIAELGSGFTSYALRLWASRSAGAGERESAAGEVSILSVDDDPRWLERSRRFVRDRGLDASGFGGWSAFSGASGDSFDLVVHDYSSVRRRAETLTMALEKVKKGGGLLLDDIHKARMWRSARRAARRADVESFSLRAYTLDAYGRFAWLALR